MPLQPVPETHQQGSAQGYQLPQVNRASLVPLLSRLSRGNTSGMSTLPYDATTRPGKLSTAPDFRPDAVQPQAPACPAGCVDAAACAAYVDQVAIGTLVIAAIISGMAGAIGGYVLRSYIK